MKVRFHYTESSFSEVESIDEFINSVYGLRYTMNHYGLNSKQVYMNRKSCDRMLDVMLSRVPEDSTKKVWWDVKISNDWLNNAPSTAIAEVPAGEIWLFIEEEQE